MGVDPNRAAGQGMGLMRVASSLASMRVKATPDLIFLKSIAIHLPLPWLYFSKIMPFVDTKEHLHHQFVSGYGSPLHRDISYRSRVRGRWNTSNLKIDHSHMEQFRVTIQETRRGPEIHG